MPFTDSAVETALEKVRELLRPDGGDILLAEADGMAADGASRDSELTDGEPADSASADGASASALKLRLVVENSDCPECILPVDMLEPIALDIMSADLPGLASVSIIDPRLSAEISGESSRYV